MRSWMVAFLIVLLPGSVFASSNEEMVQNYLYDRIDNAYLEYISAETHNEFKPPKIVVSINLMSGAYGIILSPNERQELNNGIKQMLPDYQILTVWRYPFSVILGKNIHERISAQKDRADLLKQLDDFAWRHEARIIDVFDSCIFGYVYEYDSDLNSLQDIIDLIFKYFGPGNIIEF